MTKINTILFDFDGTLMNTNTVIINSWQYTFKKLRGREENLEEIIKTLGEPLETTMNKFFPEIDINEAIDIYRSYHYENFGDMIDLFPNVEYVLKKSKEKGYKLGIVTSRLKGTTYEGLMHHNIFEYFDFIVTKEDCDKHKPDAAPINLALKNLKSTQTEAIMVGDTMFDILCAKNANVKSVLVSWSLTIDKKEQENLLKNGEINYLINDMTEILNIVE